MALARLALKNLHQRIPSSSFAAAALVSRSVSDRTVSDMQKQRWGCEIVRSFSDQTAGDQKVSEEKSAGKSEGRDVTVSEGGKKSKMFPWRQRKNKGLWRNQHDHNLVPATLYGLGNALVRATENINKLLENLSPSRLIGRMKEHDVCYKLRYEMPGLSKEEVKITVEDGFLMIRIGHKEEEKEGSDDEFAISYGFYNTYVLLPDDSRVDEIKAKLKDGVLTITIPREKKKKEVKEVPIQ